jgi:hypothetical protein
MNTDTDNEVARLRNELQGLKHAAQAVVDRWETPLWKDAEPTASVIYRLRDALAPTPEESVSKCHHHYIKGWCHACSTYTGYKEPASRCEAGILSDHQCKNKATLVTSSGYKCCKHHAPCISEGKWRDDVVPLSEKTTQVSDKEPVSDWRELSDDETICEWDEKFVGRGPWLTQAMYIGEKAGKYPLIRFRTSRPLPKQEEKRPLLKVMEYCRKWAKENLMEHEKEDFYARLGLLVDFATDFYGDEIEALKKNQK